MKFVTNKISTGKSKTFADLVSDYRRKQEGTVKTASSQQVVKTAEEKAKESDEGPSSGQLDVEPLHQTGESTPKVKGKSGGEGSEKVTQAAASTVKKAEGVQDKDNENKAGSEGETSGQTKADFPKLTNDPKAGEHRDGDGDQKKSEAAATDAAKTANVSNFGDKKAKPFGSKEDGKEETKPAKKGEEKEAKKSASKKFIVTANLDSKSKAWLKKYWSDLYMPEYADAMVVDK